MATSKKNMSHLCSGPRSEHLMCNLTKGERALVEKWARVDDRTPSQWLRINAVIVALMRESGEKPKKRHASTKRDPAEYRGQGMIQ